MNTRKLRKVLLTICSALLLVSLSVGVTLAYLTDSEVVTNTFTVGNVQIKLDELDVDNSTPGENDRDTANEYHLMPGSTYTKDPTVHVLAGSEVSYIRMIVTISDIADLKAACGVGANDPFLPQYFVTGWDSAKWLTTNQIVEGDNTCTYEFRYYKTVDATAAQVDLEPLFETITMPGTATTAQIQALDELEIEVVAHAIQASGFADAAAAWAAYDVQHAGN